MAVVSIGPLRDGCDSESMYIIQVIINNGVLIKDIWIPSEV